MQNKPITSPTVADKKIEKDHAAIGKAEQIPVSAPSPVISVSPVVLPETL